MATITTVQSDKPGGNLSYRWNPMANGDDGQIAEHTGSGDRTVQIQGTFGAGGTVVIEGSIDRSNWYTLRDPQGANLSFTSAGLKAVLENVPFIRPRVTAGDGTTQIDALLNIRR